MSARWPEARLEPEVQAAAAVERAGEHPGILEKLTHWGQLEPFVQGRSMRKEGAPARNTPV